MINDLKNSKMILNKPKLTDTHAHLNFAAFQEDREKVIKGCLENNIWMINIGTNYQTSKKAVEISQKYPQGVFASIGLHPINLDTGLIKVKFDEQEGRFLEKEFNFEKYKELAQCKKVVAIGEIGLDYYLKPKTTKKKESFKKKQKELLLKQLELAKELNLPVIFHCRMAHQDLLKIISSFQFPIFKLGGVIHCFTGTWEQAQQYIDLGLYLGFNGMIFKLNSDEVIKKIPLERILIETDCPYLPPPQFKNQRNEPLYVKYIGQRIAELKEDSLETIAQITTDNAKSLFNLN